MTTARLASPRSVDFGQGWRARAACVGRQPDFDAPCAGEPAAAFRARASAAIAICRSCPVIAQCRHAGPREEGIWGGEVHVLIGHRAQVRPLR